MGDIAFVWAAVVVAAVLLFFVVQWYRRMQAGRTADQLGGQVATGYPAASWQPPAAVPAASGQAVKLLVAGRPAVAWQSGGIGDAAQHELRLTLLVEFGAGLPVLTMFHHSQVGKALLDHSATATGIEALDRSFRSSGELDVWRPILADPAVQQALLSFPLNSVFVMGGRITFESLDGVHLEPRATEGLVAVATALIAAIPPSVTSAGASPSRTAAPGPNPTDVDGIVRSTLSRSGMSPEQQEAMMQLIRATEARRGGH